MGGTHISLYTLCVSQETDGLVLSTYPRGLKHSSALMVVKALCIE